MLNILNTITAGSAIFLAFLVFAVRHDVNPGANRWLALFLGLLGIFLLEDSLVNYGIYERHPCLIGLTWLPVLAFAPVLYLCISEFVSIGRAFRWKHLWHFLPFLLLLLSSLPFLLSSDAFKLQELKKEKTAPALDDKIFFSLIVLQIIVYLFFSFQKLQRHRKHLENITAAPDAFRLNWLLYFLPGLGAVVLFWLVKMIFGPLKHGADWQVLVYFAAIYTLAYFAMRQKEVFPFSKQDAAAMESILNDGPTSTKRLMFSEERLHQLKMQLLDKMEEQKPYLDQDLSLPSLARQMALSLNELSELVNVGFGENFTQFVNRYRVERSKQLLVSKKHAHLSMVGIAFEAGFNSKTSFNTAFKKMTGVSPSYFKNETNALFL